MKRPRRIQRSRKKGWRMPGNTVFVGRPTCWGNHYRTADAWSRGAAVAAYRLDLRAAMENWPGLRDVIRRALGGKNLACWCRLDQTCHGDVLLAIANDTEPPQWRFG